MTSQSGGAKQSLESVETVVDADFHVTEQLEDFLPYLGEPFNKQMSNAPDHHTHGLYPTPGFYNNLTRGYNEQRSVTTRDDVLEGKERFGQDRVIITPTRNLYLACIQHDELAVALANAYNEWLRNEIIDPDEGIYGGALVAPQRPTEAAEEIDDRAGDPGFVSVFFPNGGITPLAGHRKYHPIYDAAVSNDLPIAMHVASGNMPWVASDIYQSFNRTLPVHMISHPLMQMINLSDMITRGIPVRYPDLKTVVHEAGVGWIPYFLERFDHEYHNHAEDAPMLEKAPSEYILDQCYFTSQPLEGIKNPQYINNIVDLFDGGENLLFSTDYPHFDFDNADVVKKSLSTFDQQQIENIYGQTALDVYDF